jgi:hypothetical protein
VVTSSAVTPEWLYVFVDPTNSMAVMNLTITGRYSSSVLAALDDKSFAQAYANGTADFLPFVPNPSVSTGFMSPFVVGTINSYRVEYDAELARRAFFPDAPSRLTGVYAFETFEACQAVSEKYRWPLEQIKRFQVQTALRAVRVNMEIVSLACFAYSRAMMEPRGIEALWRAYWSGSDNYAMDLPSVDATRREVHSVGTIWEWIIDGVLAHEDRVES